jgi:hypothetical protein
MSVFAQVLENRAGAFHLGIRECKRILKWLPVFIYAKLSNLDILVVDPNFDGSIA